MDAGKPSTRRRLLSRPAVWYDVTSTELTGYLVANLWVEVTDGQDADLFLRLDKLSNDGQFQGVINVEGLRVSHREVDEQLSTDFVVYHTHQQQQPLSPGERLAVKVGFAPISVRFGAGEQLRLQVAGDMDGGEPTVPQLAMAGQMFVPPLTVNAGTHIIHAGGRYDSHIVLPVIPPS